MTVDETFHIVPKLGDEIHPGDILLLSKRLRPQSLSVSSARARLAGWYLAEGSACKQLKNGWVDGYRVSFSLNSSEAKAANGIIQDLASLGIRAAATNDPRSEGQIVIAPNKAAYELVNSWGLLGLDAHTKRVPVEVFNYPEENLMEFLSTYHDGDDGVTVNPSLASDIVYTHALAGEFATIHRSLSTTPAIFPDGHVVDQPIQRYIVQRSGAGTYSPFR